MAFSSQKLPAEKLSDALNSVLMEKWEEGYKDGVTSCAIMLEHIAETFKNKGQTDLVSVLESLSKNFREQVKNA